VHCECISLMARRPSRVQQARPLVISVDYTIDLSQRNFLTLEFGTKYQREVELGHFWRYPNFLKHIAGWSKEAHAQNQLGLSRPFDRTPTIVTDTDRHRHGSSIASRGKND